MAPTVLAISVCPCFVREVVYYFFWSMLIVLVVGQCIVVFFLRVLIMLVGKLYQNQGLSGVQGWAVGF